MRKTVWALSALLLLSACGGESEDGAESGGAWAAESTARADQNEQLESMISGPTGREDEVYEVCVGGVTERLRAPATAQFEDRAPSSVSWEAGRFVVNGTVDSQNGFGALLRSDWTCEVDWTGDALVLRSVDIEAR